MRDSPADSLIERLVGLGLCTPRDVHRARRAARRLTRDLPAFDSVWIDALARLGALTSFQARWLEDLSPDGLVAGDFILRDGLDGGLASRTFAAVSRDRKCKVAVKRTTPAADQLLLVEGRLRELLDRCRLVSHPYVATAERVIREEHALLIVSRFVAGATLAELLVRRGRFPPAVVLFVADQMFAGLAGLHTAGLTHGDLRLSKLRLTNAGTVVLVDAGLKPALAPELLVHAVRTPEEADGVAPERIGTNLPATAASDLYAAGCLLWQLLAGRPPHPSADPLTKLAAHQTRRIDDVREFAPDTPAPLAELIRELTHPDPQQRPRSAEAARHRLGVRSGIRCRSLAKFRRQFDGIVPHLATRKPARNHGWHAVTATVVVCGLIAAAVSDRGLRGELLSIAQRTWKPNEAALEPNPSAETAKELLRALPEPDARGVITLTTAGPYETRELVSTGLIAIQAAPGIVPEIRIADEPLRITAQRVVIRDVVINGRASSLTDSESLISLKTQRLQFAGCQVMSSEDSAPVAVSWEPIDRRDPQAGQLEIKSSRFFGAADVVRCAAVPRRMVWTDVLKSGTGRCISTPDAADPRGLKVSLAHVTLRGSGPLLACGGPLVEDASAARIEIEAADCVFDLVPHQPLVEVLGPHLRPDWSEAIRVLGDGSLIKPGAWLLANLDASGELSELESEELSFEGLFPDDFEFAGPMTEDAADSILVKTHAPRRQTVAPPGILVDSLPGARRKRS